MPSIGTSLMGDTEVFIDHIPSFWTTHSSHKGFVNSSGGVDTISVELIG